MASKLVNPQQFLKTKMQADIQLLPKRTTNKPTTFKNADKYKFFTNYYEVKIEDKRATIYQYVMDTDVPDDSIEILSKMTKNMSKDLKEKIGLISARGKMLWGTKPSKLALNIIAKFQIDGTEKKEEVLIKQTKELNVYDLLQSPEDAMKIIQVFNISTKQKLKALKMCELGRGKFYLNEDFLKNKCGQYDEDKHNRLSVWKGFKFSLCNVNRSLCLQIDVCSRVLRTENFLETLNGSSIDFVRDNFTGSSVVTRYGNYRTFRIEQIDYSMSPMSKFTNEKKACEVTYVQYFKDSYGIKVANNKQPMIKVVGRINKQIKNGKIQETPQYIYLLPEMVSLTGMSDEQRANRNLMKEIAEFTKMTPDARVKEAENVRNKLNELKEESMYTIGDAKRMDGYILDQPEIGLNKNSVKRPRDGNMMLRDPIKEPAQFKDWLFVYSQGRQSKRDDEEADYCVDTLIKSTEAFGIKMKDPGFITIAQRNVEAWKKEIERDVKENGAPQIIVLYLGGREEQRYYPELKRFLINDLKVASQCIRRRTINQNNKQALSCASKVVLQMNAKLGLPLWEVKIRHPYFREKKVMYGSIAISKGKKDYTLGFVGTTTPNCTTTFSECKTHIKRKEDLPSGLLENIFVQWAKTYYMTNKSAPEVIMVYREGLSETQIRKQVGAEVEALQKAVARIADKIKKPNYNPELVYIVANKKINVRFFAPLDKSQNLGKFIPRLGNPCSGSIILEEMSIDSAIDFHLVPQMVTQGTCTPTHYQVVFDSSKVPMEALAEFTFQQCFNYFNWQGAVRVPACMQAADKLSKLVGEHVREDVNAGELQKKPYYL